MIFIFTFTQNLIQVSKRLPIKCPSCGSQLSVKQLVCTDCETEVSGLFTLPVLLQLSEDDQKFILDFVKSSGSLKLMAQQMKLSYPTVRNKLDDIIQHLQTIEKNH